MDSLVTQILENFKAAYGLKITDSSDMFLTEKNLLEFLMKTGTRNDGRSFEQLDRATREPSFAKTSEVQVRR